MPEDTARPTPAKSQPPRMPPHHLRRIGWIAPILAAFVVVSIAGLFITATPPIRSYDTCPPEYVHPGITHGIALSDIAMVSPTEGWAVGGVDHFGTGTSQGTLLHLINGQWIANTDLPTAPGIVSISMDSPTDGWLTIGALNATSGTLAHYDGQHWHLVPLPVTVPVAQPGDTFTSAQTFTNLIVRMNSPTDGWLMPYQVQSVGHAILFHYDGTAWQTITTPFVSTQAIFYQFFGLASAGPNDLWVVGNHTDDSGSAGSGQTVFMAHYHNGQWNTVTNLPSGPNGSIEDVVMASPTNGWAAGQAGQGYQSLLWHYDGSTWQQAALPPQLATQNWIHMTVGADGTLWAMNTNAIFQLVSGQWQTLTVPNPSTDPLLGFRIDKIVPLASGDIWVMGNIAHHLSCPPLNTTGLGQGVILHDHNGQWSQTIEPVG